MTQEDKDLVLRDLCGRLPYGVKVTFSHNGFKWDFPQVLEEISLCDDGEYAVNGWGLHGIKPYLRPMSSMTEDEKKEYIEYAGYEVEESVNGRHYEYYLKDIYFCGTPDNPSVNAYGVDWLNKKMFDFRGLIPKGRAIEVTEDNNPYDTPAGKPTISIV